MFKVSFDNKEVKRFNNNKVTIVTLSGKIRLSRKYDLCPEPALKWFNNLPVKNCNILTDGYYIKVSGKSICSDCDTKNNVLGERIAETRAKITLYKFMKKFCREIYNYYTEFLDGRSDIRITVSSKDDCLQNAIMKYDLLQEREKQHLIYLLDEPVDSEGIAKTLEKKEENN